jgi:hypothetical protein
MVARTSGVSRRFRRRSLGEADRAEGSLSLRERDRVRVSSSLRLTSSRSYPRHTFRREVTLILSFSLREKGPFTAELRR